jgi:hypothetical protein
MTILGIPHCPGVFKTQSSVNCECEVSVDLLVYSMNWKHINNAGVQIPVLDFFKFIVLLNEFTVIRCKEAGSMAGIVHRGAPRHERFRLH